MINNDILVIGQSVGSVETCLYFGAICAARGLLDSSCALKTGSSFGGSLDETARNDSKDYFVNKFQPLTQLRHPNIVQFYGVHFIPDSSRNVRPLMIMEKMETNLSTLLESHPSIPNAVKLSILLDVSLGLRYLHGQQPAVVHCNLTSNNVLLTSQLQAKIGDVEAIQIIGYEKQLKKKSVQQYIAFMAPEIRMDLHKKLSSAELVCHPSVDVFSYGAVVLHTITQQWPEQSVDDGDTVTTQTEVQRHQSQLNQTAMRIKSLKSLITACLDNDPRKRPTIIQVSEFVKKMSKKLPVVTKSPIVWQAEVEDANKQVAEGCYSYTVRPLFVEFMFVIRKFPV